MVDAVVSLAIERIAGLLIHEADFLRSVRPEVSRLQDELKRMHCFLKDTDRRQDQDERVRNWISEIKCVAYDSEDLIDTFILKFARARGGACGFINKFTKAPNLRQIGKQIQSIRTRIGDITASMQTYGIKFDAERDGDVQSRMRRSYPHQEEEHFISFEGVTKDLKAQLMMEEERVRVVSVVGMGGLGKTTLAKKVYNDIHVKKHFECHSWTFISQQFSTRDVLTGILMDVASGKDKSKLEEGMASESENKRMNAELVFRSLLEKMKEEELVETLNDALKEKRYLVVLDDIWKNEAWDSLKHAFPNGKKGSKILFTTRIKDVASYADPRSTPLEPPLLNEDEGWELLSKKAFPKDAIIENEQEKLGRQMVKECGGLPLAIAVIGGILAAKPVQQWKMMQRNIDAQFARLEQNHPYGGVYGILALSYHDFPFYLKPCFLYLSQFPEDWQIQKKTLIRLWIAEGFVSPPTQGEGDETIEDRAEQYLEELVSRCMIQVSQRDHTGIGIKLCRMHDLVRDMCISKAKEENFLEYAGAVAAEASSSSMTGQSRRIAIVAHAHEAADDIYKHLLERGDFRLRSLLFYFESRGWIMIKKQGISIFKSFRLLRVLNIENTRHGFVILPKEIGNLIHLRYLGLSATELIATGLSCAVVPASISNLRSLCTLDLRGNHSIRLDDKVCKLGSLRHLLLSLGVVSLRLDSLRNLETLKTVEAKCLIKKDAVMQMTNLRSLSTWINTKEVCEVLLKSPSFALGRLRSLKMAMPPGDSFPNLEALSRCRDLTKAFLSGSLHHSLEFLPGSLIKLRLNRSSLEQDPMVNLEKLPNLRFLSLEARAYIGSEIVCSTNGFPKLEILCLGGLFGLEEWRIAEGAMPCLRTLQLETLDKLKMIPEGLKFIRTLQELRLLGMSDAFKKRVKTINGVKGEDFDKLKDIASISFDTSLLIRWPRSFLGYYDEDPFYCSCF